MDKNTIVGLVLIAAILFTFNIINTPDEEEVQEESKIEQVEDSTQLAVQDSLKTETVHAIEEINLKDDSTFMASVPAEIKSDSTQLNTYIDSVKNAKVTEQESFEVAYEEKKLKEQYGIFSGSATGEDSYYTLENDKIIATISSKGAQIIDVKLKEYQSYTDYHESPDKIDPMSLFDKSTSSQNIRIVHNGSAVNTAFLYFTSDAQVKTLAIDEANKIILKVETGLPGKYIEYIYSLAPESYDLDYTVNFVGLESDIDFSNLTLDWAIDGLSTEKLASDERMIATTMYKYKGEGRDYLSERSDDEVELEGPTEWVAFKHKFFSSIIQFEDGFKEGKLKQQQLADDFHTVHYSANLSLPAQTSTHMRFYFGPNEYEVLAAHENGMEDIINLGWGIFRWVNQIMIQPIFNLLKSSGMAMGLIILLVTLIVKIIITPLTYKNYMSSAKMRVLKPEIDKLNEKYADNPDPMKKQQEQMALYRATGVNPMAGCIPMLIQMPILLAVFRFFPSSIYLRHKSFLWADDLSSYDSIWNFGTDVPMYGDHMSLFALLMAASTLIYTIMNSNQMNTSQPGMPNMKIIMYIFPVMMLFFFNNYSAGLSYYYLCGNLMNIGIMWGIKKYMIDEDKIRLQLEANKAKPKKKSTFQRKLEEMSKQQQQNAGRKK